MKKLFVVVLGFGMVSTSIASAAVGRPSGLEMALGEKQASQMNGRMLACGRPGTGKNAGQTVSQNNTRVRVVRTTSGFSTSAQ